MPSAWSVKGLAALLLCLHANDRRLVTAFFKSLSDNEEVEMTCEILTQVVCISGDFMSQPDAYVMLYTSSY